MYKGWTGSGGGNSDLPRRDGPRRVSRPGDKVPAVAHQPHRLAVGVQPVPGDLLGPLADNLLNGKRLEVIADIRCRVFIRGNGMHLTGSLRGWLRFEGRRTTKPRTPKPNSLHSTPNISTRLAESYLQTGLKGPRPTFARPPKTF